MKTAPISRRILAYLIDSLIAFLVFVLAAQLLVFVPLRHLLIGSEDWFRSGWNTQAYTLLTMSLPTWLYFALSEISPRGGTLGKRLLNLKTVTKGSQGKMTLPQSLARTLVKLLPWEMAHLANNLPMPMWYDPDPGFRVAFLLSPILVSVYIALTFLTKERQSLHDLAARTVVLHLFTKESAR
ncbi:MAG: RDD family protein [Anaerolineales bacterium]|nr:MAG: RDD family protein [Anaerolineales bacterium]